MNAKELKDALLRSVDFATRSDADWTAKFPGRIAETRRRERAETLISQIAYSFESDPELASAFREFLLVADRISDDEHEARQLAASERFTHAAPEPAKPAGR